jgi:hypothetical protein
MNRVPDKELALVPGGTLMTATPEEGRALAITMARHMIHNIQPDLDILKDGRPKYGANPDSLIAASQVVAPAAHNKKGSEVLSPSLWST